METKKKNVTKLFNKLRKKSSFLLKIAITILDKINHTITNGKNIFK
jgi:hypothetical protein